MTLLVINISPTLEKERRFSAVTLRKRYCRSTNLWLKIFGTYDARARRKLLSSYIFLSFVRMDARYIDVLQIYIWRLLNIYEFIYSVIYYAFCYRAAGTQKCPSVIILLEPYYMSIRHTSAHAP